jgi:hypothetical protein
LKVVFVYLAQLHQVPHTFPIAMEMARLDDAEIHIAAISPEHLDYMRVLAGHYPGVTVSYRLLYLPRVVRAWVAAGKRRALPKKLTLLLNLRYLRSFDAIVVPERTSLFLKRFDLKGTQLIWTGHGGGDRESGYTDNVRRFDFVLLPGQKLVRRHLDRGNVRAGRYGVGGYAKFDLICKMSENRPPLFNNGRRTVVYNPHFWPSLSSWPAFGFAVLDFFAQSREYNLVFAPHVRLFDPPRPEDDALFQRYKGLDHIKIDLGSTASIDMTYTWGADIYLGDVSSQIAEFLIRPRPIVFLDPRGIEWQGRLDYRQWSLGVVARSVADLPRALDEAVATHHAYLRKQRDYFTETFELEDGVSSAARGAAILAEFLRNVSPAPALPRT